MKRKSPVNQTPFGWKLPILACLSSSSSSVEEFDVVEEDEDSEDEEVS